VTVSSVVSRRPEASDFQAVENWFGRIGVTWLRLVGLAFLFLLMSLLIYIPVSIVGALFFLFSATLGTIALLVAPFIIIWIVIYLSFAPPGITLNKRPLIQAVKESVRLVQKNLPLVLLMLLIMLLLGTFLDWLLIAAENGTWFTLFNILIHAFVNTGFVTAFFILYQDHSAVLTDPEKALDDNYI
jgi:membrane-anchored glycerophosphoryl diester phosphodiesterase (GDPDase)